MSHGAGWLPPDMSWLRAALIRLYPTDWRRRYGGEMAALLEQGPLTLRAAIDLVAGAIDARFNPQWTPASVPPPEKGMAMTTRMFRCAPAGVTVRDQWRSAGWMIGGSIALTTLGIALRTAWGPNALSEGLLYAAFPAALMLSSECTYLKPYSRRARTTMAAGGALLIVLIVWAAVAVASRI